MRKKLKLKKPNVKKIKDIAKKIQKLYKERGYKDIDFQDLNKTFKESGK